MKPLFLIIVLTIILSPVYSQKSTKFDPTSKELVFIPRGNMEIQNGSSTSTIAVDAFFMSNEITNKEFREFYEQVRKNPNDTIYWVNYSKMVPVNPGKDGFKKPVIEKSPYSKILPLLIDLSVWNSEPEMKDYFFKSKYDNYPVVGVTFKGAVFFCMWKTNRENKNQVNDENQIVFDYRLPTEFEWEYAAMRKTEGKDNSKQNELHNVSQGEKNKLGLYNLKGNVSEWTSTTEKIDNNVFQVVKGGSWKTIPDIKTRVLMNPGASNNHTGFRIVRSHINPKI